MPATVVSTSEARPLMLRSTVPVIRTSPTASAIELRRRVLLNSSPLVGCMVAKISRQLVPTRRRLMILVTNRVERRSNVSAPSVIG
jgi:hypothetical protein